MGPSESSVISSSRSSCSVIGAPCSSYACSSIERIPSSRGSPGVGAAPAHLRHQRRFHRRDRFAEARVARQPARAEGGEQRQSRGVVEEIGEALEQRAQALHLLALGAAEGRAHHHLVADRLHPRPQRERLAHRPARDLRARDLHHHLPVGAHPLAVEGGQHEAPVGHVLGLVQQHHRARPQQRSEQRVGLAGAGAHQLRGDRQHPADVLGVTQKHPRPSAAHAQSENISVAPTAARHERQWAQRPAECLQLAGQARPGGAALRGCHCFYASFAWHS